MQSSALPAANTRVILRRQGSRRVFFSWSSGHDGNELVLLQPDAGARAGNDDTGVRMPLPQVGEQVTICWQTSAQYFELPAVVIARRPTDKPDQWRAVGTGPPSNIQRRRFARARTELDVVIAAPEHEYKGTAYNIGEGGLNVALAGMADVSQGTELWVHFTLGGQPFAAKARVAHTYEQRGDYRRREVGLQFVDLDLRIGDQIRKFVFSEQIRQRKVSAGR